MNPIKVEVEHPLIGFDGLEAFLDEQRPHRWNVGPSPLELMNEDGGILANEGSIAIEASISATEPTQMPSFI